MRKGFIVTTITKEHKVFSILPSIYRNKVMLNMYGGMPCILIHIDTIVNIEVL